LTFQVNVSINIKSSPHAVITFTESNQSKHQLNIFQYLLVTGTLLTNLSFTQCKCRYLKHETLNGTAGGYRGLVHLWSYHQCTKLTDI